LHSRRLLVVNINSELGEAEHYVAEGKRRVEAQRSLLAKLEQDGLDTTQARELLATLESSLARMIIHRASILKEISAPRA
jgi:hypothetical protein